MVTAAMKLKDAYSLEEKLRLSVKDPDARQKDKGMKEDETVGWHHQLNGHQFE